MQQKPFPCVILLRLRLPSLWQLTATKPRAHGWQGGGGLTWCSLVQSLVSLCQVYKKQQESVKCIQLTLWSIVFKNCAIFPNLFYWNIDTTESRRTYICFACLILLCLSNFPLKECIMVQHTSQIHNDNCNLLSSHWALAICFNTNWVSIAFLPWEKSVCKPFTPSPPRMSLQHMTALMC